MQETQETEQSASEDPLGKGSSLHSIPWPRKFPKTEESGGSSVHGVAESWSVTEHALASWRNRELNYGVRRQDRSRAVCIHVTLRPAVRDSGLSVMFCFLVQVPVKTVISLCENSSHNVLKI